jgi:ATP-dependent DNA ligase
MALSAKAEVRRWSFPSGSSNATYSTVLWEDGSLSCDCPGWRFKRGGQDRSCKHTIQVAGQVNNNAPPAATKPPAPKKSESLTAVEHQLEMPSAAKFFKPMLAHPYHHVFTSIDLRARLDLVDPRYVAEPKFDGSRGIVFVEKGRTVAAFSRLGNEVSGNAGMSWIREVDWPVRSAVIDGEFCSGGGLCIAGKTVEQARSTAGLMKDFVVFDLLGLNGQDLKKAPYEQRRALLEKHFGKFKDKRVTMTPKTEDAKALWDAWVEKLGGEGIMLKDRSSWYVPGWRSPHWLKVAFEIEVDVVVLGFTNKATYNGGRPYKSGEGACRYGFFDPKRKDFVEVGQGKLGGLETKAAILGAVGQVAVMKCKGVMPSGALRSGRFVRWRDDKAAKECVKP